MFNLLKVMEIVMLENEGNPDISWDGLIQQIRDKIRHYIKLMVEGSNICDIGHRDWAPVPALFVYSRLRAARQRYHRRRRAL
jgi:formate C-acetyltransferase